MKSISFNKNINSHLSQLEKDTISSRIEIVLSEAQKYVSTRLVDELYISSDTIENLNKLCQTYQKEKICLFTGAGVSFTESKYYKTPGWWDLLREIYGMMHSEVSEENLSLAFRKLSKTYPHPWQMASFLESETGSEKFAEILCQLLYRRTTTKDEKLRPIGADEDKRLPIAYLHQASTLNAVIAICSSIRAIRKHPCFKKNEKIKAILTLNYDCFLEAGATQKYNSGRFKPRVTNKPPRRADQLPVYHIHGYIPYGGRKPAKGLVLTEESYQKAYQKEGDASIILNEFLSSFSTLFIGISFNDELLLKHLERLAKGDEAKDHFAFLKIGTSDELLNRLQSVNVFPILFEAYEQIPLILEQVYQTFFPSTLAIEIEAKIEDKIWKVGLVELTKNEYWELLLYNKK